MIYEGSIKQRISMVLQRVIFSIRVYTHINAIEHYPCKYGCTIPPLHSKYSLLPHSRCVALRLHQHRSAWYIQPKYGFTGGPEAYWSSSIRAFAFLIKQIFDFLSQKTWGSSYRLPMIVLLLSYKQLFLRKLIQIDFKQMQRQKSKNVHIEPHDGKVIF